MAPSVIPGEKRIEREREKEREKEGTQFCSDKLS